MVIDSEGIDCTINYNRLKSKTAIEQTVIIILYYTSYTIVIHGYECLYMVVHGYTWL